MKVHNAYNDVISCEYFDKCPKNKTCLHWRNKMTAKEVIERDG